VAVAVLPGLYSLSLTNLDNGCQAGDSVLVTANVFPPVVAAGAAATLSCTNPLVQLSAVASSPAGDVLGFDWTTMDGHLVDGAMTPSPAVDAPGTYVLTVTDTTNGCTATDSVTVLQDASLPAATAVAAAAISCFHPVVSLDGTGSELGPDIQYEWNTPDGNILSGQFSLTPVVDAPGTYVLTVTNAANDCQSAASVTVSDDTHPPPLSVAASDTLTCDRPVVDLEGILPAGIQDIVASWTFPDGSVLSADSSLSVSTGLPGLYLLTAVDTSSGCTASAQVSVPMDTVAPQVSVSPPASLSCQLAAVPLQAMASAPGNDLVFLWQTTDGALLSDPTSLLATAGGAGTYVLLVTDASNGCAALSSVIVTADVAHPVAMAGPAPSFGCDPAAVLTLDGSASSQGTSFLYAWSFFPLSGGAGQGLVGDSDILQPQIDAPGWYVLTVTDSANGCAETDSVLVLPPATPPSLDLLPPATVTCSAPVVFLQAQVSPPSNAYLYVWSTADGQFATSQDIPSPGVLTAGSYSLTLTDTAGSCSVSASVLVEEDKTEPGAFASADTLTCLETAVALSGSSPTLNSAFQWSTLNGHFLFGQQSANPGVDTPGDYTLTVTNPTNGCTSTATVTVIRRQLDGYGLQVIPADCADGTGSISFGPITGGAPPFLFSVDGGLTFQQDSVFEDLPPASYALVIKDADQCRLEGLAMVMEPPTLSLSLPESVSLELGTPWMPDPLLSVPAADLVQVAWGPAEWVDCPTCLQPIVNVVEDGLLTLSVTDANGCQAAAATRLSVRQVLDVFAPNVFSPDGDGINDRFTVFARPGQIDRIRELQIFSRWGELVFDGKDFEPNDVSAGWDGFHRGKLLDAGVFVWVATVRLTNGKVERLKGEVTLLRRG
jgi:gliding motility-associated-like protein